MALGYRIRDIGRLLVEAKALSEEQLQRAVQLQARTGQDLADAMVALQLVSYDDVASIMSLQHGLPLVSLKKTPVRPEAVKLIPETLARKHTAIPISIEKDGLLVAMKNPGNIQAIDDMAAHAKMRIKCVVGVASEIIDAVELNYKWCGEIERQVRKIPGMAPEVKPAEGRVSTEDLADTPVVKAVELMVNQAVRDRASDIHIEPQEYGLRVRFRIDGVLHEMMTLPSEASQSVLSRLKIMAGMNIAEKRRPQDGQFSAQVGEKTIDVRAATVDTIHGEMMVLRILDKSFALRDLAELGFLPETLEKYLGLLKLRAGVILISGPTGSGKTTTLYASVNKLDRKQQNIITVEDPVEYRFQDINQIQVNVKAGLTFAAGLRSIMRLDPNVILLGEIRDSETAQMAVQAALTGHLVLSSIHASDAAGVPARLIDLGVQPFLVATSVAAILSQRMARQVCPHCHALMAPSSNDALLFEQQMGEKLAQVTYGKGCTFCAGTGYLNRTGLFELLTMSDATRQLVLKSCSSQEIRAQAIREGMITLLHDGMLKVKAGITTPSEVIRTALMS
jgi:general secretion pathway protein E